MRPLLVLMLLGAAACSRSAPATSPSSITVPPEFQPRPVHAASHPMSRGTIRLGESEFTEPLPPPTATGGGPPAETAAPPTTSRPSGTSDIGPIEGSQSTSVGPMSPSTVTGTKSPIEPAKPATPAR